MVGRTVGGVSLLHNQLVYTDKAACTTSWHPAEYIPIYGLVATSLEATSFALHATGYTFGEASIRVQLPRRTQGAATV